MALTIEQKTLVAESEKKITLILLNLANDLEIKTDNEQTNEYLVDKTMSLVNDIVRYE